jgi:hypothetical protein
MPVKEDLEGKISILNAPQGERYVGPKSSQAGSGWTETAIMGHQMT